MGGERRTILFVTGADEWYGSDYVLYEIVRSLEGTEFDALVLVPDDMKSELAPEQRLSGRLRARGVTVHSLPLTVLRRRYMTPWGAVALAARMARASRAAMTAVGNMPIALVHSHTATVHTGAALADTLGVPHVWHVSEMVERPAIVRRHIARTIVRSADRIAAVSHAVKRHLEETEPTSGSRIEVIHNGLDSSRFSAAAGNRSAASTTVVGMLGRIGTWKGQELFLDAARIVAREFPEARFVMAGGVLDGNTKALERLRALAQSYGIGDRVTIQEYCADTPALLATFDVFVQPSLRPDPLPTTILEAMASGCPVVATAHGGAPEMVVDGVTGRLTPPGDATAMAAAILGLLRDPGQRHAMGARGKQRVDSEFSPAAFSAAYLSMYRALVSAPR